MLEVTCINKTNNFNAIDLLMKLEINLYCTHYIEYNIFVYIICIRISNDFPKI